MQRLHFTPSLRDGKNLGGIDPGDESLDFTQIVSSQPINRKGENGGRVWNRRGFGVRGGCGRILARQIWAMCGEIGGFVLW